MDTDENGILAEAETKRLYQEWVNEEWCVRVLGGHGEDFAPVMAKAQHDHDVAVVKNMANPYPFEAVLSDSPEADRNREHMAFEQARVAILAALGGKHGDG